MAPVVPTGTAAIAVPGAAPPVQPEAYAAAAQHQHVPSGMQSANQTAEFFLSNYRLGKTLGIGSFGKVKVAEHILTGHKVAIKILNRRKIQAMDMEEKVRREIKILRLFMHPHIIRLYEVIETPTDIYVVMEYVKGGELFDHIVEKGRLAEDDARRFFQQIISGVEYCHRNMVVHRDLKPENLLLDSNLAVKIADFGLSNVMRDGHFLKTSCGSPNYAAPEVISGKLYAGPEVDVWSCGVILYALLCGSLPFDDENIPNLFKKIKGGIYNLPSHLSPGARDLIPRMLLVDPLKRITLPEVRQHPWFTAHLPRYLAVMQADTGASHMRLDEECVQEVVRLGFDRQLLLDSLRARQQNKATVTYYLLADNRRGLSASAYLSGELNEGGAAASAAAAAAAGWGRSASLGGPSTAGAGRDSTGGGLPQQRLVAERKWRLGLGLRGHPSALMGEVYRALAATGCGWKKLGPYALKCRKVVVVHPSRLSRMSEDGASDMSGAGGNGREPGATSSSSSGGGPGGGGAVEDMASETSPGLAGQPAHPHLLRPTTSASGGPGTAVTSSFAGGHPGGGTPGAPTAGSGSGAGGSGRPPPAAVLTPDGSGVEYLVKFELALYKVREEEYALDVQRLEGEMLVYLDVAGRLLGEIRA